MWREKTMMGKLIISQIFAISSAWAFTSALTALFSNVPAYVPIGIWAMTSLLVLVKLK
jgi:hypothetical protein